MTEPAAQPLPFRRPAARARAHAAPIVGAFDPGVPVNDHAHPDSLSEVFQRLVDPARGQKISLREILDELGERGYGALIVLLCLPNFLPFSVPGFSALTGLPIAFFCLLLLLGVKKPWLPAALMDRSVDRSSYASVVTRFVPWLVKMEGWVKPRLPALTSTAGERVIGLVGIPVAILLAAPIPFGNPPPAIALALLALGVLERDGRCVILGYAASALAFGLVGALVFGLYSAGSAVLGG
ncbi:MAG: exopolysaccharide biosynthesis protein [Azospirillum sp.]|nr:exopolysaccharide biosynthesis protein [Azospirillum sp.]MCZ8124144.1 exopolysaccharide biosynthesis protein [Magnetospirillum sp.]